MKRHTLQIILLILVALFTACTHNSKLSKQEKDFFTHIYKSSVVSETSKKKMISEKTALKSDKENKKLFERYRNIAITAFRLKEFNEALDFAQKAVEIKDEDLISLYIKAYSLYFLEKDNESLEVLDKVLTKAVNRKPVQGDFLFEITENIAADYIYIDAVIKKRERPKSDAERLSSWNGKHVNTYNKDRVIKKVWNNNLPKGLSSDVDDFVDLKLYPFLSGREKALILINIKIAERELKTQTKFNPELYFYLADNYLLIEYHYKIVETYFNAAEKSGKKGYLFFAMYRMLSCGDDLALQNFAFRLAYGDLLKDYVPTEAEKKDLFIASRIGFFIELEMYKYPENVDGILSKDGCRIFNPNIYKRPETKTDVDSKYYDIFDLWFGELSWNGKCAKGVAEGKGVLKTGDMKYECSMQNGVMQGAVTITKNKDRDKIYGTMKNGVLEGKGKIMFQNGNMLEGTFVNGKINGKATLTSKNGDVFKGLYIDNRPVYHFDNRAYCADGTETEYRIVRNTDMNWDMLFNCPPKK